MSKMEKAIIIGGGIAGKLSARVLSDFFKEVIMIERDPEPNGPFPRKGVHQGAHLHALLHAGQNGLEELFPGISEKFYSTGAIKINSTQDLAWFHHGVWKLRFDGNFSTILQTRPHLEWHIEQFIKNIPNVTVLFNQVVADFMFDEKENRINGVELQGSKKIWADLVVDASGSSTLTSNWLTERAIHIPEETVKIGLSYISKFFHLPEGQERDWKIKYFIPILPTKKSAEPSPK